MEYLKVPILQNGKEKTLLEKVYNIEDFPYDELAHCDIKYKRKGKRTYRYINTPIAFDIECTTLEKYRDNGDRYGEGFMYHWQLCLGNKVVFGRRWEEFITFIDRLILAREKAFPNIGVIIPIFVHNLSYEFQFIKDFFKWENVFCKQKHKVIYARTANNIEFRCSFFLSNMSLQKMCENSIRCIHYKLVDTYDYKKLRTPNNTLLTEEEKAYCYNDVRGLCECIESYYLEDNITTLPLTNTGFVRREFRKAVQSNPQNRKDFERTRLNVDQYKLIDNIFRGGNTHASRHMSNTILHNVHSFDMQSSYIGVMMMDYFPVSPLVEIKVKTLKELQKYLDKYCCMLEVDFFGIHEKKNNYCPYIDIAHCKKHHKIINDNGRIKSAEYIGSYYCTEIDLKIILDTYDFKDVYNSNGEKIENIVIKKCYISQRGKLNKEFRERLMYRFGKKCTLRNIIGKEYEYGKSKNRLNSSFGMTIQKLAIDEITYTDKWEESKKELGEVLDFYYKSKNSFLIKQQGIYVTAHARRRLQEGINICGADYVYGDTDSCKFINENHVKEFEQLNDRIMSECENNDIPAFIDYNGKRFYLSLWEYEGMCDTFKTLGAKKYCFQKGDKFEITVAGMNKKKGSEVVGDVNNFNIGTTYEDVGRTVSWYNDEKPHYITVNGDTFLTSSNIGILDATYTLGVTKEYWELIKLNPQILYK